MAIVLGPMSKTEKKAMTEQLMDPFGNPIAIKKQEVGFYDLFVSNHASGKAVDFATTVAQSNTNRMRAKVNICTDTVIRALPLLDKEGMCDVCKTSHRPLVLELADIEIYMCIRCAENMQDRIKTVLVNHLLGIEEDE